MGTPVTTETIKSWYDPSKKGIIVVGMMRSGTHYLTESIYKEFSSMTPDIDVYGEIPAVTHDRFNVAPNSLVNGIISEFTNCANYSISSAVIPSMLPWLFNYAPMVDLINRDYTVVKLVRNELMKHVMSSVIFHASSRHSGITADQLSELIQYPIEFTTEQLTAYMYDRQYVDSIRADYTVAYEDLAFTDKTHFVKNNYGVTPEEFFSNYDFINSTLASFVTHNGG